MTKTKKQVTFTLSDKTQARLAALAKFHETSKAGMVEQAIREKADRDGITLPEPSTAAPISTTSSAGGGETAGEKGTGEAKTNGDSKI